MRRSGLLLAGGFVCVVVICAFAYLLVDSQSQLRKESEKRFQSRAEVSAAMTDSLFATAAAQQQEDAAKAFGDRDVDSRTLAALVRRSQYGYALVLDGKAEVLAATPRSPRHVRQRVWSTDRPYRAARGGRSELSGLIRGSNAGSDVIEWALPFETRFGRRVQVVALNKKLIGGFLDRYLARGRETPKMHAHLIDGTGNVIAGVAGAGGNGERLPAELLSALSRTEGTYREGGEEHYFASAPVAGSSWRMLVSQPARDLYPILATGRTWLLWGVLAAFAAAAAMSLVLFRRMLRSSDELTRANARIERRRREVALANERLEAQKRLAEQASQAKSAFLANMSHELRTPLNAIIGFSELMMDGSVESESERKEYLGHVVASGRHLEQLVNDILDLSKVEAGKLEFYPQRVDLPALIGDLTGTMRVLADKKRIALGVEVSPEVQSIVTDPARFKQVLYNYLSNALKFTPPEGRVSIRVEPAPGDRIRLAVEDTGIGIAPDDQRRLFQEFEQIDQSFSKEHPGTGLGLALVKRLVEAQGGEVWVQSAPGEGSVFYAELPRVAHVDRSTPAPDHNGTGPAAAPVTEAGARPAVLVVEDDSNDQALLSEILSNAGCDVEIARTGADAAAKAREHHFDVVLLDLILPDASGFDVLKTIREEGKNKAARVIVVTMVKEQGLGKAYTVSEWLVKPIKGEQLLAALEHVGIAPDSGTVLVVDDDLALRKLAEATIEQLGFRVVCAAGGEEGLAAAAEHAPLAAIVLDLLMPGVDGFEFLERLRSTDDGGQIPVIVWTSKDLTSDEQAALLQSAQGLVGKSQRHSQLVDELKPYLAGVIDEPVKAAW